MRPLVRTGCDLRYDLLAAFGPGAVSGQAEIMAWFEVADRLRSEDQSRIQLDLHPIERQ